MTAKRKRHKEANYELMESYGGTGWNNITMEGHRIKDG